jgi:predicted esterase
MSSAPSEPSFRPSPARVWSRRVLRVIAAIAVAALVARRLVPRPAFLPLATRVDGPAPAGAAAVVVFLHGKGGSLKTAELMAKALRGAGLPGDVAIVLVEGPYHTWVGHQWGDTAAQQASSRQRLRQRLRELLGDRGPPPARVIIAGFSQGAGVAIDMAVEEPRIGAVASLSPCRSMLRDELPKRPDLRVLLAHGTADEVCPVEQSRSLARALDEAHRPAQYVEFDGPHMIPLEVVRALARFTTTPLAETGSN